jgi:hypothetical protein
MDRLSSTDSVPLNFAALYPIEYLDREIGKVDGKLSKIRADYRERRSQKPLTSVAGRCYRIPKLSRPT